MTHFRHGQWVDNDGEPIDLSDAPTAGEPKDDAPTAGEPKDEDPREGKGDA